MSICVFVFLVAVLTFPLTGNTAEVRLMWDAPTEGTPIGYMMERKLGLTSTYRPVGYPKGTTWVDKKMPAPSAEPVCYQVRAFNERGKTGPSNELCLRLPSAPMNMRLETAGSSETPPRVKGSKR